MESSGKLHCIIPHKMHSQLFECYLKFLSISYLQTIKTISIFHYILISICGLNKKQFKRKKVTYIVSSSLFHFCIYKKSSVDEQNTITTAIYLSNKNSCLSAKVKSHFLYYLPEVESQNLIFYISNEKTELIVVLKT